MEHVSCRIYMYALISISIFHRIEWMCMCVCVKLDMGYFIHIYSPEKYKSIVHVTFYIWIFENSSSSHPGLLSLYTLSLSLSGKKKRFASVVAIAATQYNCWSTTITIVISFLSLSLLTLYAVVTIRLCMLLHFCYAQPYNFQMKSCKIYTHTQLIRTW